MSVRHPVSGTNARLILSSVLSLLALAGCEHRATDLSYGPSARLYLDFLSPEQAGEPGELLDAWRLAVLRPGEGVIGEANGAIQPNAVTVSAELLIDLQAPCETLTLRVELLRSGEVWFRHEGAQEICASGSNPIQISQVQWVRPSASVSPSLLPFTLQELQSATQSFTVQYPGVDGLAWTLDVQQGDVVWLDVVPASGQALQGQPSQVQVTADAGSLPPGQYVANIVVSGEGFTEPIALIPVTLTVTLGPRITLDPQTSISITALQGLDPNPAAFSISNSGGGTLQWTATDDAAWLTASPSSGSLGPGQSQTASIGVASANLEPGSYQATVSVADPRAKNSPQSLTVNLLVRQRAIIGLNPSSLAFTALEGTNPQEQSVEIANLGENLLEWKAVASDPWLSVEPLSGDLPYLPGVGGLAQTLTVGVESGNLNPGTYQATITFTDPEAGNSPQVLPVELTVTPRSPPTIENFGWKLLILNDSTCGNFGSRFLLSFNYSDPDGDVPVSGGFFAGTPLTLAWQFLPAGFSGEADITAPTDGDGFSGTSEFDVCIAYEAPGNTSVTEYITLRDGWGLSSNTLSINIPRPPGANTPPEPSSGEGGMSAAGSTVPTGVLIPDGKGGGF